MFAALGIVVARMFGHQAFTFYENGVISINLPLAGDVLGARATRTTHPKVLRGFEAIFSALLDCDIKIRTPLQWLTKKEVSESIVNRNFGSLLSKTVSLIDDVLACTERVLNPAAHAGNPPLYNREVQDALGLIRQLESTFAT